MVETSRRRTHGAETSRTDNRGVSVVFCTHAGTCFVGTCTHGRVVKAADSKSAGFSRAGSNPAECDSTDVFEHVYGRRCSTSAATPSAVSIACSCWWARLRTCCCMVHVYCWKPRYALHHQRSEPRSCSRFSLVDLVAGTCRYITHHESYCTVR